MFNTALGLSISFFIIAVIAGIFGFGIVGSESMMLAKIFFFVFVVLAVLSFVGGIFFNRRTVS